MGLPKAQLEVMSFSKEFVLPQTEMFNPRTGKKRKKSLLTALPGDFVLHVEGLSCWAVCTDSWMEPDSVVGNGISCSHLRQSEPLARQRLGSSPVQTLPASGASDVRKGARPTTAGPKPPSRSLWRQ